MTGQIHIGIAGWSYPDWQGIVYTSSKMDQLEYVSRFVDCLEINSTFYRPPIERNSQSWLQRTAGNPEFFFTAKLNRIFTHEGKIDAGIVKQFHTGFEPLLKADKLKHLLVQFRYDFSDNAHSRQHLSKIVGNFSDAFHLTLELRHKSWENPNALKFLEQLGVTICNLDYPTTWNSFTMQHCTVGTNGYFRLHGRNTKNWFSKEAGRDETYNHYYNADELAQIKQRIDRLAGAFESLTVIANNHYRGAELANALELKALISGQKQVIPEGLLRTYPNLARIALSV
ncbi:DUF72 domain-containing protein [Planctomycetota bacterium]